MSHIRKILARKMIWWLKTSLCKHEDWSLGPQSHKEIETRHIGELGA